MPLKLATSSVVASSLRETVWIALLLPLRLTPEEEEEEARESWLHLRSTGVLLLWLPQQTWQPTPLLSNTRRCSLQLFSYLLLVSSCCCYLRSPSLNLFASSWNRDRCSYCYYCLAAFHGSASWQKKKNLLPGHWTGEFDLSSIGWVRRFPTWALDDDAFCERRLGNRPAAAGRWLPWCLQAQKSLISPTVSSPSKFLDTKVAKTKRDYHLLSLFFHALRPHLSLWSARSYHNRRERRRTRRRGNCGDGESPRSFLCNATPELLVVLPETEIFKHSFLAGG